MGWILLKLDGGRGGKEGVDDAFWGEELAGKEREKRRRKRKGRRRK